MHTAKGRPSVLEHVPTKCETLSSNPSTTKKKKLHTTFQMSQIQLLRTHILGSCENKDSKNKKKFY
jgi:hypothetical protein